MPNTENDPLGAAVFDYYNKRVKGPLMINTSYGEPEEMPIEVYFRDFDDMLDLEQIALDQCDVKVLDVGACAGAHSLFLQGQGHQVTAMDNSAGCITTLKAQGIKRVQRKDFFRLPPADYGTILMMMNGLGLAGKLSQLVPMLNHMKTLLRPGGFVLADSSDISYLYEDITNPLNKYYGEVSFQFEYDGQKGSWFDWLYIDSEILKQQVAIAGWSMEVLYTSEDDAYLVRMWPSSY
ncbi:MAG: class I SAM-dependent methyltransferase [Cyclobacteriaceae bacterium]